MVHVFSHRACVSGTNSLTPFHVCCQFQFISLICGNSNDTSANDSLSWRLHFLPLLKCPTRVPFAVWEPESDRAETELYVHKPAQPAGFRCLFKNTVTNIIHDPTVNTLRSSTHNKTQRHFLFLSNIFCSRERNRAACSLVRPLLVCVDTSVNGVIKEITRMLVNERVIQNSLQELRSVDREEGNGCEHCDIITTESSRIIPQCQGENPDCH